jgi:hypothetical protein
VPDAGRDGLGQLNGQLVIAVHRDLRRIDPGGQRDRKLAAGAHVYAEALFCHPAQHRTRAERFGRVADLRALLARGTTPGAPVSALKGFQVLPGAIADVCFVGHEQRRAEIRRQVTDVDAAERQHAIVTHRGARPDDRVQRVEVGGRRRRVVGG